MNHRSDFAPWIAIIEAIQSYHHPFPKMATHDFEDLPNPLSIFKFWNNDWPAPAARYVAALLSQFIEKNKF